MMGVGLGMGGFGFIWMVLVWVGLIVLGIWLVGLLFPSIKEQTHRSSPSAQDVLKTRYAQGELSLEQYQEMLKTVQQ
jgi:uncharacterized membrane protein